jgi:hypothetical protein
MANNFDEFPLYDALIKKGSSSLSDIWVGSLSTFYQNLIGYLTQNGIFLPVLTTAQMNDLPSPQEGQIIYNIDATPGPPRTAALKVWQVISGVAGWHTITTT